MKRKLNVIEGLAIYLAKKSVNKSIPIFSHKVEKPKNIEKLLHNLEKDE